jgi:hypothetical protein
VLAALSAVLEAIRSDTTTIIRGGSLDPVWPYRISPFPRGDTRYDLGFRPRPPKDKGKGKPNHTRDGLRQ